MSTIAFSNSASGATPPQRRWRTKPARTIGAVHFSAPRKWGSLAWPSNDGPLLFGPASAATTARELFVRALGISDAFDMMETAALLLDRYGRVVRTNKVADAKLGDHLRIVNGHLMTDDRNAATALRQLIEHAIGNADAGATMMPPVAILRPGRRAMAVYAVPLSGVVRDVLAAVRAIVVIRDLEECSQPPEAHVRNLFGLTSAEAKLATRVASSEQLEHAADELGIAYQTARNQMQAIFAKTDTHRQAEIVALFARLQAAGSAGK
jgi:DNA-binding CsgD family transcriptional regulator